MYTFLCVFLSTCNGHWQTCAGAELNLQGFGKEPKMEAKKPVFVRPEHPADIERWAKKWGVTPQELYDAILLTGCLETERLKGFVHRDRWIYHPVSGTARLLKAGINLIF